MTAAWTSRTSTCGRPVSQVIARSASLERLALDDVDELLELGLGDRLVRLLALLAVGRREALDELAGDPDDDLGRPEAGHLLGLLERDRAVVDDGGDVGHRARLHVATGPGACGRRRGPCRGRPSSISKTSALANSVPTSSAVQAASASPSSRCQIRRQKAIRPAVPRARASRGSPPSAAGEARRAACPCPGPSPAGRRPGRRSRHRRGLTRSPAEMPRATRSSRDGDEELRLVGVEAEGDDARTRATARRSLAAALSASIDSYGPACGDEPDARARPPRRRRRARPASGSPAAAAGLEPALRLAQLVLERGDPVRRAPSTDCAPTAVGGALERRRTARARGASAAGAGQRPRSGASRSRCSARR